MKLKEFKANLNPQSSKYNFSTHKNVLNKLLVGTMASLFKNKGFEFEDYRKYTAADDASRIDWKATLRAGTLLIRETIEEKAVNVLFLVDVSDSMLFSSGDKLKCEYTAEIISGLAFAILREGNAVGLVMFNDKIVKSMQPKVGSGQYYDIIRELSNPKNYGGKCDLKNAIKNSLALLKVPSLVVILSDFIDVAEGWEKFVQVVSFKYDVMGFIIRDLRDRILPKDLGYFVLEDPTTKKKIVADTKEFHKKYNTAVIEEEKYLDQAFKKAKSDCIILQTDQEFFNPLIRFLEKRARIKI
ncbi:DUF58 domain-containing protein [Candidatus Woesearchaeota archaeon]|nr:DUF58 domain-containing protein [Candidatus Woesearchaeota archaeon]